MVPELEQRATARTAGFQFRDVDAAARHLTHIRDLVPNKVYESLSALLPAAPDPDAAVNQFERLAETSSSELLQLLEKHPSLVHYAVVVFGYSPWLGETLIHNHDLFHSFTRERRSGSHALP